MISKCRNKGCYHEKKQHFYLHKSNGGYDTGCMLDDCECDKFRR